MGDGLKKIDNLGRGNRDARELHARPRLFRLLPRQLGKTRHLWFLFLLGWETGKSCQRGLMDTQLSIKLRRFYTIQGLKRDKSSRYTMRVRTKRST